jgi:hypothetical protein
MVADIELLQGKIIEDPEQRSKKVTQLIEALALEILSEDLVVEPTKEGMA